MKKYDSFKDTWKHKNVVTSKINKMRNILSLRAYNHDRSKLESPEKEMFDKYAPLLKILDYGTLEYMQALEEMKETALKHHYENNSHHPEHFDGDIGMMSLFDIVEMFCDWWAASDRMENGNMYESLKFNKERFDMSYQLYSIFVRTVKEIEELEAPIGQ